MQVLAVHAHWDAEAHVWWAESDDVPGLATEAATFPELVKHVQSLAPILMRENLSRDPRGTVIKVFGDSQEVLIET